MVTKQNNISLLFLGFWTPPAVRPRAIMAGKIVPELKRQGIELTVMTYETCGKWDINIPIYEISEPYKIKNPLLNKFFSLWNEWKYYRDIANKAEQIIGERGIDVIFSFSNPQNSNILGAILNKRTGIPFVSHFSDPWVDNPYKNFSASALLKAKIQEKFVVKHSDAIIFTNGPALELVMKKYPAEWKEKATVIQHCFNPADYPEVSKIDSKVNSRSKFVISHVGAFYKERTPEPLFKAVKKILLETTGQWKNIEIQLVGAENDYTGYRKKHLQELIDKYDLGLIVKIIPKVGFRESLKYMKEADLLVVIDADFEGSPFFPSKVVDYAGSGTPILGLTPEESPTADFLRRLGYKSFEGEETSQISSYLSGIISENTKMSINKEFLERFDVQNIVKELINQFKKLTSGKRIVDAEKEV